MKRRRTTVDQLTPNQIKFLMSESGFFEEEDLYKIFETTDVEYLSTLDIEVDRFNEFGMRPVYLNGKKVTSINIEANFDNYLKMINKIV